MLLTRDRLPVPAGPLPAPAPLPNLREALARRAEVFDPFNLDEPPPAPRGLLARCIACVESVQRQRRQAVY